MVVLYSNTFLGVQERNRFAERLPRQDSKENIVDWIQDVEQAIIEDTLLARTEQTAPISPNHRIGPTTAPVS